LTRFQISFQKKLLEIDDKHGYRDVKINGVDAKVQVSRTLTIAVEAKTMEELNPKIKAIESRVSGTCATLEINGWRRIDRTVDSLVPIRLKDSLN
jgi:hypothetical protein